MKSVQGLKPMLQLPKFTKKISWCWSLRASFHQQSEAAFGYKNLKTYYTHDKLKSHFRIWKMCTKSSFSLSCFRIGVYNNNMRSHWTLSGDSLCYIIPPVFSFLWKEMLVWFLLTKHKDFQNDWKQVLNLRNDQY